MDETLYQTMELVLTELLYMCVCVCVIACLYKNSRLYIQKSSFDQLNRKSPGVYLKIVVLLVDNG